MPPVATRRTAKLFFVDGSGTPKTHEVYPMEGDFNFETAEEMQEFKHRGAPMADGEGIVQGDKAYQTCSFSYMAHDLTDAVKTDALIRWMKGDTTTTTAIASAGWTATTTRTVDSLKTLTMRWYPQGTGSGKPFYDVADCVVVNVGRSEAEPTIFTIEMRSTTATDAVLDYGP
jgi:hypothetical protein